jgi:uncharacterized protein YjiS (DUF1127 family)
MDAYLHRSNTTLHRTIESYFHTDTSVGPDASAYLKVTTMLTTFLRFLQSWKRYNASLNELSRLDDRELADIGLNRSDIPRVAWENSDR